jgi:putative hydrolase of the HAD superfamily
MILAAEEAGRSGEHSIMPVIMPPSRLTPPAPVVPPAFVYFDLGNVLAMFDRDRAFARMSDVCGADPKAVRAAVMKDLQADLERGRIGWPDFHAEFSRRTGTRSDPTALAAAASDMFWLNVPILPVVAALERARVPIGILSNTCDVHWHHIVERRWGIVPGGFREIILSYEVGCSKPDAGIFEVAAARAGVAPERIFFCDDLPEHVAAARAAGWDAEPFTTAAALARDLGERGLNLGL